MEPRLEFRQALPAPPRQLTEAMAAAQDLAFAPVNFMTAVCLRRMGVLQALFEALGTGLSAAEVADRCQLPLASAAVLLESGLAIRALQLDSGLYSLSKLGHVLHRDPMTQANMDFVHQVCYRGLFHMEQALRDGKPAGLKTISPASTVYEGLSSLAPEVREAWLRFDHFYSDGAFDEALALILQDEPESLLDVGGNTGRFARLCLDQSPTLRVTLADLPQQVAMAQAALSTAAYGDRLSFCAVDLRAPDAALPGNFAAVSMSQFLVCFEEAVILQLLRKAGAALREGGQLYILDTFWDRQDNPISAFCLMQTSPYFTTIANGVSRMYRSDTILALARQAGLSLRRTVDGLGMGHTLLAFAKR